MLDGMFMSMVVVAVACQPIQGALLVVQIMLPPGEGIRKVRENRLAPSVTMIGSSRRSMVRLVITTCHLLQDGPKSPLDIRAETKKVQFVQHAFTQVIMVMRCGRAKAKR